MNKIQRWWSGLTSSLWFVPTVATATRAPCTPRVA